MASVAANMTTGGSWAAQEWARGLGRMFYIVSPRDTLYQRVEDVPDFYKQAWPFFLLFMLVEHCLLRLEGRPGIRLNDGLTSISLGIFQECGKLVWRGAECYMYTYIHTHWRVVELPWQRVTTWYAAALAVDFCYYWMHRACHEIHILWAQHQVHHSSEDFNMGVGVRQSVLQGWCGFVFFLPMALGIPPAQFVLHQQLSYLYMFWVHTECVLDLGPLEYVLNTPSHHRVHHGSNKYCLDVNYGGVLIIWDRLFGTFAAERRKDKIVYGLVYNQPSFNPLHLQTFYTRHMIEKCRSMSTWKHRVRAVLDKPSWSPDGINPEVIVENRVKFDVRLPNWRNLYLVLHYSLVLYYFHDIASRYSGLSAVFPALQVICSLSVLGLLLEGRARAAPLEVARCAALAMLAWAGAAQPAPAHARLAALVTQAFYAISAAAWAVYSLRLYRNNKMAVEKRD